ncbi:hypothetical protein ESY86_13790 [Subsaximicrobium wynnwilliamsii]|uniref:Uncharacterized protein n=1 Tax=Subsaximicrobium wynnwilliamsii TaxID=291179 RepID=A0A5C6ZFW6_9FLAO|nr:hypothetical protein [Subsaximicrobium wynnwilliamsii]TXD82524.1 hypothetical protein ESY87_13385 [Subsaximicrobium wynnwilliamsii]TXD88167.1 hypothetical protein ESY86_13790 [Subsaximicrobium wynnwilliamsii]TXE02182.1 hypothetical protein ESY88_12955 [Subsaximicrobium wynnwilliamsii]
MKNLFFALAFMLVGTFAFANDFCEETSINSKDKLEESSENNEKKNLVDAKAAEGPCFIIVQTKHKDGTRTLHGSVYTAEPGCSGTAVLTINEQ